MKPNLQEVINETKKCLGQDADLSYLTEDFLEEAVKAKANNVDDSILSWEKEGNTITVVGNVTKWRDQCSSTEWWQYTGSVSTQRVVNCLNGFQKFKIRPA